MAALMLRQGVDLKVVQRVASAHRHATTADIYATFLEEVQRGGAERMATCSRSWGRKTTPLLQAGREVGSGAQSLRMAWSEVARPKGFEPLTF